MDDFFMKDFIETGMMFVFIYGIIEIMANYKFCFRSSSKGGDCPGKLYLKVVHEGLSCRETTPYEVWPGEWDAGRHCLIVPRSDGERKQQLLNYKDCMAANLWYMEQAIVELEKSGDYTVDDIMHRYRSIMSNSTLEIYAEKLAVSLKQEGYGRTARAYRSAVTRFVKFNGGNDILLGHITAGAMNDFQQVMKFEGRSLNTLSFYMRTLRAIYNKAIEEGRTPQRKESPFVKVYTGIASTRKLALTHQELLLLTQFDPTITDVMENRGKMRQTKKMPETLKQALAIFLFCFHARGMGFVDMAHLKKSDLWRDILCYQRRKTGQVIEIRILPSMRRVLDYFAPMTAGSEYLFPIITDPDKDLRLQYESGPTLQNQRLKRIATIVGINKKLSTHCARHSWAMIAKNKKLPISVISEGLGHTNQKKTELFLASLDQSALDRASKSVSDEIDLLRRSN